MKVVRLAREMEQGVNAEVHQFLETHFGDRVPQKRALTPKDEATSAKKAERKSRAPSKPKARKRKAVGKLDLRRDEFM